MKKILIGSQEICGIVAQLASYYKSKGYSVVTIAEPNPFYNYTYDIDPYRFLESWKKGSYKNPVYKFLFRLIYTLSPIKIKQKLLVWLKIKFIQEFDIYINIWHCFLDEEMAFEAMKKKGGKWITLMVGDDFRDRWVFKEHFKIAEGLLPGLAPDKDGLIKKLKRMRLHEKNADVIFSVPDQSSLALRPYLHYQLPIELFDLTFKLPENKKLRIIHCPSDIDSKGSSIIEKVLKEILEEGYEIEFLSLRKVPHMKLMEMLSEADILVDELVFHGPGSLSFEAMASGCAVLTRYFEASPECFRPPVISVTAETLKTKLKHLLDNRDIIKELAIKGRKYVEENNNIAKIADSYLDSLSQKKSFDYIPGYFRNEFSPAKFDLSAAELNLTTDVVRSEPWYKEFVAEGKREELIF